jgi:hypothetical protein
LCLSPASHFLTRNQFCPVNLQIHRWVWLNHALGASVIQGLMNIQRNGSTRTNVCIRRWLQLSQSSDCTPPCDIRKPNRLSTRLLAFPCGERPIFVNLWTSCAKLAGVPSHRTRCNLFQRRCVAEDGVHICRELQICRSGICDEVGICRWCINAECIRSWGTTSAARLWCCLLQMG